MKTSKVIQKFQYAAVLSLAALLGACGNNNDGYEYDPSVGPASNLYVLEGCEWQGRMVDQIVTADLGMGGKIALALYRLANGNSIEAAGVMNLPSLEDFGFYNWQAGYTTGKTPFKTCVRTQSSGQLGNGAIQDIDLSLYGVQASVTIMMGYGASWYGDQASLRGQFIEGSMQVTINGIRQDLISAANR